VVAAVAGCARAEPAGPDQAASRPPAAATPTFGYRVLASYPHDPGAFTQGLAYVDGTLYEATGSAGVGPSSLRRVDLATGAVQARHDLAGEDFGEGIAVVGDRIVQLTWQSQTGFVYDRATFRPLGTFRYPGEGWGLAYDGQRLIMSDGTDRLRFLDPTTFVETGSVEVRDAGRPVDQLNELEYIDGQVYANVWQTDRIVRIDPATGHVTAVVDLAGLLPAADRESGQVDVLNGIAYDPAGDRMFVTGKLWPKLFEIELVR
jgi:glutaminyl-peptide cyclotransferase